MRPDPPIARPILVTGFGPFPGVDVNPSAVLARRLAQAPRLRRLAGGPPRLLVLRTVYDDIEASLAPALADRPAAVLMIGVATRATRVRVEMRALNRVSRLHPDASGRVSGRLSLEPAGPPQRRSAAAQAALRRLRERGVSAILSRDAGRYLCNASYYRALREGCPVLFLHIPPFPRDERPNGRGLDRLVAALVDVAQGLIRDARRR